jgi:osmotically-inducible protein OsmY
MKHFFERIIGMAALAVFAALPALAEQAGLKERVESRLVKAKLVESGAIQVAIANGAVVLDGAVTTVAARNEAEKAARKESKVVENRLRVVPEERSDKDIEKDARSAILRTPFYGVYDSVEMGVENGVVTLAGSVYRGNRKSDIESAVARVRGVRAVESRIEVQSVSFFDDQLRRELYARIYGNFNFVQYSNRANPPIRIVVDHGRVTLTGWVQSNVDRALLENVARGTLAFDVLNHLHVDGETPQDAKPAVLEGPAIEI